ncbi:hypothetical protein [Brevirhabdus sp.]|uniref:hypothetical protein n=1 Tax=Brevirhabdus sp. TaxID=2004514 RepID=UPI0040598839
MLQLLSTTLFACRFFLAAIFAMQAIDGLLLPSMTATAHGRIGFLPHVPHFAQSALFGLLLTISIWLLFGVRSRVVALLGIVLSIGYATQISDASAHFDILFAELGLIAALGLPLIAFGGGRWAIYQRGWGNLL